MAESCKAPVLKVAVHGARQSCLMPGNAIVRSLVQRWSDVTRAWIAYRPVMDWSVTIGSIKARIVSGVLKLPTRQAKTGALERPILLPPR